jgi:DNA repair photolyase
MKTENANPGGEARVREIEIKKAFKEYRDYDLEQDFKFPYHLTPYQGCTFGCVYCFNTKTDKYWAEKRAEGEVVAARNIVSLVRQELPIITENSSLPLIVRIGTEAEIYGPAEEKYQLTRGILNEFLQYKDKWKGEIPTKSELVLRDIDLLKQLDFHVTMTIVTTNDGLAKKLEPSAPSSSQRIETLRKLREAGIRCRIRCEPYLPGISDLENLEKIKDELGIEKVKVKKLNYYSLDEIRSMMG